MLSSIQQDSIEVVIPPTFLGIFRDLMITFWNYVLAKLYEQLDEQSKKRLRVDLDRSKLTLKEIEYLKFSGVSTDYLCEILTEIIRKEMIEENKSKEKELDNFFENNKDILLKLCKLSLILQQESNISGKTNITVRFGAQDIEKVANKFNDIIYKGQEGEYYKIKDKEDLKKVNIRYGKLPKTLQKYEKKKEESINIFYDWLKKECEDFISEYNGWFRRVAYEFGRGFAIENLRGKIQLEIFADLECKLIYEIPIFIRIAQELTEVKINEHKTGIYILTSEIYEREMSENYERDYEILSWFFNEELEKLKNYIGEIIDIYLKKYNDIPLIYDLIQELVLLDIVYEFLRKSIAYVYKWPSLRIYYLSPPKEQRKQTREYIVIDIPSSLIEIANLAIKSSAEKLHISSIDLLKIILKLVKKIKSETTQSGIPINDLYVFIHTVLQGNPDIDLFYRLERSIYSIEG